MAKQLSFFGGLLCGLKIRPWTQSRQDSSYLSLVLHAFHLLPEGLYA